MTPTNAQELKELAELREYVKELEEAVQLSCWDYDASSGFNRCCHCGAWDVNIDGSENYKHKPDCIVTKIRNRRGE